MLIGGERSSKIKGLEEEEEEEEEDETGMEMNGLIVCEIPVFRFCSTTTYVIRGIGRKELLWNFLLSSTTFFFQSSIGSMKTFEIFLFTHLSCLDY